jgi:serine/threonine-protein kinase
VPLKPTNLQERYELKEVLGRGGMGVVYHAVDKRTNREVVVKAILDVDNADTVQLFYNEWTVLSGIVHPNVVNIYDIGEFDDNGLKKPFLAMPLLPGVTLEKLIKEGSPRLSVPGVLAIIDQAGRGLQAAHEKGLVHRNVKPSNIFVMDDNSVKVLDFGIARDANANSRTAIKGTLAYFAPEQLDLQPATPLSDLFALAGVAYEALTRQRPFRGADEQEVAEAIRRLAPPPVSDLNHDVPQSVSQVIQKAMAKQPGQRFFNTREFADALQKASRSEPGEHSDGAKIRARLQRAAQSFEEGDYDFAAEVLNQLEAEGHFDQEAALLRARVDQAVRQARAKKMVESARRFFEASEYPLALRKAQEALDLDPGNNDALALKGRIEHEGGERRISEWMALARQHLQANSFRQAREALDSVLKLKPNDPTALGLLAEVGRRETEFSRGKQTDESSKARCAAEANKYLEDGDYDRSLQTVQNGLAEFPNDAGLLELERLVRQHQERAGQAMNLLRRARDLGERGSSDEAAAALRQASQLDPRNTVIRTVLINSLLDRARRLADTEPDAAEASVKEILDLEPSHAGAQSLLARLGERKGDHFISWCLSQAHRMQTEGDFDGALAAVNQGLAANPNEPRLRQLEAALQRAKAEAAQRATQTPAGVPLPPPPATPPPPPPVAAQPAPPPATPRPAARPMPAGQKKVLGIIGAAAALLAALGGTFWFVHNHKPEPAAPVVTPPSMAKLSFGVAATPLGADIAVDGNVCGKSTCLVEIGPGSHTVVAKLGGYQDASATFNVDASQKTVPPLSLMLQQAGAKLSIATDLPAATIKVDGNASGNVQDGAGEVTGLAAGKHKVQIDATGASASFNVDLADGQAPAVSGLQANSLRGFVLARFGNDAKLYGNLPGYTATLDGASLGPVTATGSNLTGLSPGPHELAIDGPAKQHDEIAFEALPASAVYVSLRTDRLVGTLRINVNQPQAEVYLNGEKYRRPVLKGKLTLYLPVKQYTVRVQAEGFAPSEQTVQLKGGAESALNFTLAPARATLAVHHAPPGAEVLIDGKPAGTVLGDGDLSVDAEVGRHSIVVRHPQYKNLQADRILTTGKTTDLDAALEPLTGTIRIDVSPADARLRLRPENGQDRDITGTSVNLPEGNYTITASAPRYQDAVTTVRVSANKTVNATLNLRAVETKAAPKTAPAPATLVTLEEIRSTPGWSSEASGLVKRGGDLSLVAVDFTQANIRLKIQSLKGKRTEWVVGYQNPKNYYLMQMDDKNFYRTAVVEGKRSEQVKVAHGLDRKQPIGINIAITPSSIVHSLLKGSEWVVIDKWEFPAGLVKGRFGFEVPGKDEIAISEFQLTR